jgi:hypothetical protein
VLVRRLGVGHSTIRRRKESLKLPKPGLHERRMDSGTRTNPWPFGSRATTAYPQRTDHCKIAVGTLR